MCPKYQNTVCTNGYFKMKCGRKAYYITLSELGGNNPYLYVSVSVSCEKEKIDRHLSRHSDSLNCALTMPGPRL